MEENFKESILIGKCCILEKDQSRQKINGKQKIVLKQSKIKNHVIFVKEIQEYNVS